MARYCKGGCGKYIEVWKGKKISPFAIGLKKCSCCSTFIRWNGKYCPCCGCNLSSHPKSSKARAKLREIQKVEN